MATDYTSVDDVKAYLGISADDTDNDIQIQAAVTAASLSIDRYTGCSFSSVTEARLFHGKPDGGVWVDPFTDPTDLVVETGSPGYWLTTIPAADVVLWPPNAASNGMPYRRIYTPYSYPARTYPRGYPNVRVTARWGFTDIPADVGQAALLKAAALYRRKDSPEEFGGALEDTSVALSRSEDSDVRMLLAPYRDAVLR